MITLLQAEIVVEPGWAVGAVPLDDPTLDRDLLVDAAGRPWVPGSTLAGSLRAHLRRHDAVAQTNLETDLMGSRPPTRRDDPAETSRLWLLGTRFTPQPPRNGTPTPPGNPSDASALETVGQTGIDRFRGAATATSLRYSRTVGSGGVLTAYLRFDGELTDDQRAVLAAWRPAIGRDRTTGGGRARLRALRYGTVDPADPAGMTIWLSHSGEALVAVVATRDIPIPAGTGEPWLTAEFIIEDALLVGDPRPTGPAQARTRAGQPIVPGTAWKGIFRSRVEYILRSLFGERAACQRPDGCGECPTCTVFGHQGSRGRLAFADSVITEVHNAEQLPVRTQVAIDRVTGGARDGQLFQSAPVTTGRLQLRIDALDGVEDWVYTAFQHVLLDLNDRTIGVGSRVTRGMGTLRLAAEPPNPGPVALPDMEYLTPGEVAS